MQRTELHETDVACQRTILAANLWCPDVAVLDADWSTAVCDVIPVPTWRQTHAVSEPLSP